MKARELREKTDVELEQSLAELRKEIFEIGIKTSTGQVEKTGRAGQAKRDIARIMTILGERERASGKK